MFCFKGDGEGRKREMTLIIFQLNGKKDIHNSQNRNFVIVQTCYNKWVIKKKKKKNIKIFFLNKQICSLQSQVNTSSHYSKDQRKTTFSFQIQVLSLCIPICCTLLESVSPSPHREAANTKQRGEKGPEMHSPKSTKIWGIHFS